MSALLVGLDLLKKALKARPLLAGARARRRVLLMGSFETQVGGQWMCGAASWHEPGGGRLWPSVTAKRHSSACTSASRAGC